MSSNSLKKHKHTELSFVGKSYLIVYNGIQTLGWSYLLLQSLTYFLNRGTLDNFWQEIKWTVLIFQNAALLEVLHAAIRLVPSSVFVVLMQVYSRVFLVAGILLATEAATVSPGLPLCVLAWSITEIIRYAYYALNLVDAVPQMLTFFRYSTFLVLYPLGITGELLCMYHSLEEIAEKRLFTVSMPNKWNFIFNYYYFLIFYMLLYIPFFPYLFGHMLKQRRKMLSDPSKKSAYYIYNLLGSDTFVLKTHLFMILVTAQRSLKMDRKSFNLVLCVFSMLAMADANPMQSKTDVKWGHGLSATVNDYVDKTITMIVPFLQENGLDPMDLPDIVEGFEVKPIIITYSAWLRLYDGQMRGLVNVARHSDQDVKYFAKMLRVRLQLQFTDLEFDYKYLVKVMNIGPTGGIIGSLDRFVVTADVLIDFNNDDIHLQQFSITNIGRLRVRFTGNILTDWLVNPIIGVFTRVFNSIIMKFVEVNIRSAAQMAIVSINSNIRDIINVIESHN
ncbi:uncharacterized protein LOC123864715 [Maniola jurtina]|uniref:uncharacterized protein LOC123864715 n=1 Tax=Maniola jurtina TaxID=191418 RepID=UPI001E68E6B4|nr:uncharacterized protein LOC123864715 [Maniola jurtina]